MKFNFRKIASVITSAVMLSSTIGIAAAASYPAPFVRGGAADVAVVIGGADAARSDLLAATDVGVSLQAELAKQTATTTSTVGSVDGEATGLFTGSSKLWANDSINSVKNVVTKTEMPTILADGSFSGDVDATYVQTLVIGGSPILTYDKMPTSSDDPAYGYQLSTSQANYLYNASVTFNRAVNFTNADSKNQQITLFGQKFTVGAATSTSAIVLLKEATTIDFDSSGVTSQEVTISGKTYTVEMVSASSTTAIIKVTDENGNSEQKEITTGYSKKVNGVTIAVNTAASNYQKYAASIVAGAEKMTFTDGSAVTYGDSDTVIDGTLVDISSTVGSATKLMVSVYAPTSDNDAIKPGQAFVDPVFGTFRVDFTGLNIPDNSTSREEIKIQSSGDDKSVVEFTDYNGKSSGSLQWAINKTNGIKLQHDSDGHNIIVQEMVAANRSDMIMVGNEDEGHLIKVSQITNQTTAYSQDAVKFTDVLTGDTYTTTITAEGTGTVTIGGKAYGVTYYGDTAITEDAKTVRLNYPDSAGNDVLLYPTISTSKGAKLAFYKQIVALNLTSFDGTAGGANVSNIKVPNGADGYQSIAIVIDQDGTGNFTVDGTDIGSTADSKSVALTNTGFSLNFTYGGQNNTMSISLNNPAGGAPLTTPAIMIFEEKDDNSVYEGLVVTLEGSGTSTDGIGINDVIRTWTNDAVWDLITMASDNKKTKDADLWGTIVTIDSGDSDQKTATISYPDEQIYAQVYVAENDATITPGSTSSGSVVELGSITVEDSDISSVSDKNLIVIGGSCINSVAAKMLGSDSAICGADFTTKTGVGADQFLIEAMASPYNAAKVAVLVAGYEAADTEKAVTYLTKVMPATDAGKKYKGTSATSAELVTTSE